MPSSFGPPRQELTADSPAPVHCVGLTTCTDSLAPGARSTAVQCSVSDDGLPWIEQLPGPEAIDQSTPGPPGSGSSITTPVAVPVPATALLLAVTVNPICSPALTDAASAVLTRLTSGHSTLVVASSLSGPLLLAVSVAVFG